VRLGRARSTIEASSAEVRDAFGRALAVAESGSDARRDALMALADLDLADGRAARAELWLERMPSDLSAEIVVRRAQARLSGRRRLGGPGPTRHGRTQRRPTAAPPSFGGEPWRASATPRRSRRSLRAVVLDRGRVERGALRRPHAHCRATTEIRARVTAVVDAYGARPHEPDGGPPSRARGASTRGRERAALREAVESGDSAAALPLVDAAMQDQDAIALGKAGLDALGARAEATRRLVDARHLARSAWPAAATRPSMRLRQSGPRASASQWASAIASGRGIRRWIPRRAAAASAWAEILARLARARARRQGPSTRLQSFDDLSAERARPLAPRRRRRVQCRQEHVHQRSARSGGRIGRRRADDRGRSIAFGGDRIEVVDTPGFNSLDPSARRPGPVRTGSRSDLALWLLDATQALKDTERAALEDAQRRTLAFRRRGQQVRSTLVRRACARFMRSLDDALAHAGLVPWVDSVGRVGQEGARGKARRLGRARGSPGGAPSRASSKTAIVSRRRRPQGARASAASALEVTLRLTAKPGRLARSPRARAGPRQAADWRRTTARSAARLEAEEERCSPSGDRAVLGTCGCGPGTRHALGLGRARRRERRSGPRSRAISRRSSGRRDRPRSARCPRRADARPAFQWRRRQHSRLGTRSLRVHRPGRRPAIDPPGTRRTIDLGGTPPHARLETRDSRAGLWRGSRA
jgi:hypothetical protein